MIKKICKIITFMLSLRLFFIVVNKRNVIANRIKITVATREKLAKGNCAVHEVEQGNTVLLYVI